MNIFILDAGLEFDDAHLVDFLFIFLVGDIGVKEYKRRVDRQDALNVAERSAIGKRLFQNVLGLGRVLKLVKHRIGILIHHDLLANVFVLHTFDGKLDALPDPKLFTEHIVHGFDFPRTR